MKAFLEKTAPLNRAIVSDDFDRTLDAIAERIPLTTHRYPTGTQVFDWVIPRKWTIRDAYIERKDGTRVLDWKRSPLHIITGSVGVPRRTISRDELLSRIKISDTYPEAIPYHFKYYELDWGFCMSKNDRDELKDDEYVIAIDAEYADGELKVGEHVIPGESDKSIVLIAHIDHPAQVNDGLAGAAVLLRLAEMWKGKKFSHTIRMHFLPETIGSIAYLHHNQELIGKIVGAAFCEAPGTPGYPLVLQHSRDVQGRFDRIAKQVLLAAGEKVEFAECFSHVLNDDGFYNAPGIDIPCLSFSRTKKLVSGDWHHFPYYHTSGDTLARFDFDAAERTLQAMRKTVEIFDADRRITKKYRGLPNLSRHKLWIDWRLYPKASQGIDAMLFNLDDGITLFDLSERAEVPFEEVCAFLRQMEEKGLVELAMV